MEETKQSHDSAANPASNGKADKVERPLVDEKNGEADENALTPQLSAAPSEEPEYPGGVQVALIMTCILCAIFLMSLDRTIIATAIPTMTDEFNSINDIGWYGSAFMLTTSCFQLLWGKVYTFYPAKYVFLALLGLFEVGSAICGAAPNSIAFIIGRAVAGMGSAGILSGAIVLMISAVPLAKRPLYNGFFSAVLGTSSVVGPLLGGAFASNVSWRWCFYINLPIGGAAMLVILLTLKATPPAAPGLTIRQQLTKLDLLGEFFLFPSLICLLLALQWGGSTYHWNSWRIILLFVLFGICLIAFIVVEVLRQETATIQLRVIKNRSVISAMWYMFCLASTMLLFIYYLPIWLQAIEGKSAVQSGIDTLPFVISLVVASTLSGQLVGRLGYYTPFTMLSSCLMPVGAGLISTFKVDTSTGMWIGYQILLGFGIGLGLQHGPIAVQTVLERKDVPMGVSLVFFCQQLGGAIFVSVGQNVLNTKLISGLVSVVKDLDPQTIVNTGATTLRNVVPAADLPAVLVMYNEALRWVFIVGAVMASLSALGSFTLEWRSVKGKPGPPSNNDNE
ncbi:putative HC-toxin efflux carrier TOXA [Tolypocladium ophioglossoides CBS 100239]|uniref:Putative HC-toxin efflux carrier TOXA n=1 Tax=Tolypocladium ophioglossoides (strain CBS 100239) TaxID=1163406 RepID=A0A0L0NAF4_TOLOC|nr:putative HC-toxin efflux carrier TOXA [Tolypocladium ophioglossoides CBS 100239]